MNQKEKKKNLKGYNRKRKIRVRRRRRRRWKRRRRRWRRKQVWVERNAKVERFKMEEI